jgi:acyl dehydratase
MTEHRPRLPFQERYFDDYEVGDLVPCPNRTITEADVVNFAAYSGDWHPAHTDQLYAERQIYGERILQGMASLAIMTGLMFRSGVFSDASVAFLGLRDWRFRAPIRIGDTISLRLEVIEKRLASRGDRGVVTFHIAVLNRSRADEVASEGDWVSLYLRRPESGVGDEKHV